MMRQQRRTATAVVACMMLCGGAAERAWGNEAPALPQREPSDPALVDAVNRVTDPQVFVGRRISAIVKALVASTAPGCDVALPRLLDVQLSLRVGNRPLFEALAAVLSFAGLQVDVTVTGTQPRAGGKLRDCRLVIVARKEPGPGVFAITPQGLVQLPVFGEASQVSQELGRRYLYSPGSIDRIPAADSVQSFVLNMPEWSFGRLFMVVSREQLATPEEHHVGMATTFLPLGVGMIQVFSRDLPPGEALAREYRRRVQADAGGLEHEAFLVVELSHSGGLMPRTYPIRVQMPAAPRAEAP